MINLPAKNKEEAIRGFEFVKIMRPFTLYGKWYFVIIDNMAYFRKTEKSILNIIHKKVDSNFLAEFSYEYYHYGIDKK